MNRRMEIGTSNGLVESAVQGRRNVSTCTESVATRAVTHAGTDRIWERIAILRESRVFRSTKGNNKHREGDFGITGD